MKRSALLPALLLLPAAEALAHPGHGQPGWLHQHGELLLDAGPLLAAAAALALLALAVKRRLAR
jgi:hypothetical protein